MDKLSAIPVETLREALRTAESAKATKRLMIAIAYKDNVSVETLSERYGLSRSTIYSWLDRFEDRSMDAALHDDDRPGRPPKLDEKQRTELRTTLASSPASLAYERSSWTPELLQEHIEREFGVSYSLGHVRRLLHNEYDS